MKNFILLTFICIACITSYAQSDSSSSGTKKKGFLYNTFHRDTYGKNIIRYNPVPTVIFMNGKNAAVGYERVLWHNQSISANLGYFLLPPILDASIGAYNIHRNSESGFITSVDYRFYLGKLNSRPAPNGIYIGPYFSMYDHKGDVTLTYIDNSGTYTGDLKSSFALYNFGVQLGYQFIFYKRLSLDLILCGPSLSFYDVEMNIDANIPKEKADELRQKYYDSFFSKYPAFGQLFNTGSFKKKDIATGVLPGFRYLVQIGYSF